METIEEEWESLSDDEKLQRLETVWADYSNYRKMEIIKTIEDDDKKIKALRKLNITGKGGLVVEVIQTIRDDNKKIKVLKMINADFHKATVISEMKDDNIKILLLDTLQEDYAKVRVISSLDDHSKQIKALEKLRRDYYKALFIVTIEDYDERIKLLELLSDVSTQIKVITTIKDDDKKIQAMEKLNDDFAKITIISTLEDDNRKIYEASKLNNPVARALIIEALQGETSPDSALNNKNELRNSLLDKNRTYTEIGLDPRMTIGMEIETEGIMSSSILSLKKIVQRQDTDGTRAWETISEGTLNEGVEIISPILTDNEEDVEEIYIVSSLLEKCAQEITERCGGHIHIGADYLTSKEAYINLFEIWGNAEKIIYKIGNEKGSIPRIGIEEYATTISPKLNQAIERGTINLESEESLEQFISEIQEIQGDRFSGLNLLNVNNGKNTIEFRVSNGTINPDTWVENARLYGRIVQVSQKLAEIEKQLEQSEENKRLLELKECLKEEIPEEEKMEILLKLLFSVEERDVYRERYVLNSELLEKTPDDRNPLKKIQFSKVDFKRKRHNIQEFHKVIEQGRVETIDEVTRETVKGVTTESELKQFSDKVWGDNDD